MACGHDQRRDRAYDPANGPARHHADLDLTGTTQYGSAFAVNNLSQDGYTSGRLAGVDIDTEGVVFSLALYQRPVIGAGQGRDGQVQQPAGSAPGRRHQLGGELLLGHAAARRGRYQPRPDPVRCAEASNVDIAEQLVNLITAQRNFQANAEVISTADAITQTIINIR